MYLPYFYLWWMTDNSEGGDTSSLLSTAFLWDILNPDSIPSSALLPLWRAAVARRRLTWPRKIIPRRWWQFGDYHQWLLQKLRAQHSMTDKGRVNSIHWSSKINIKNLDSMARGQPLSFSLSRPSSLAASWLRMRKSRALIDTCSPPITTWKIWGEADIMFSRAER